MKLPPYFGCGEGFEPDADIIKTGLFRQPR